MNRAQEPRLRCSNSVAAELESRRNRVFLILIRTVPPNPPALWYTFTTEGQKTRFLEPVSPVEGDRCVCVGSVLFSYLYRSSPLWSVSVPVRALGSFLPVLPIIGLRVLAVALPEVSVPVRALGSFLHWSAVMQAS
jgi:hypothetical protein